MSQAGLSFHGRKKDCDYCGLKVSVQFNYCQHCGGPIA